MKALILVGGYGTRLRPLTFSKPKPLVPFANKAIVLHQIEKFAEVGVTEVILAVNYQPQVMVDFLKEKEKELGIKITISKEDEPLGTAGPVALAKSILQKDDAPFFMFNSDVICEFPLKDMLAYHKEHGKEGTIFVTPVQDPSKYGVVVTDNKDGSGQIQRFVEKPQVYVGNTINAGMYLFNPSICDRIQPRPTSIEREIFPKMASEGQLFAKVLPGYWMDIGQPKDYLTGSVLHLNYLRESKSNQLAEGAHIKGNVIVHPSAKIGEGCTIGPDVVIGANVVIGNYVRISRSTLMSGVQVKNAVYVHNSLIGWDTVLNDHARVEGGVYGEDVKQNAGVATSNVTCCPHKGIKANAQDKIIL